MQQHSVFRNFSSLLRWSVFTVFLGRAWQHLYWDAPYRSLLWDESLMSPIIEFLSGLTWETYVTSPVTEQNIILLIRITGILYLIIAGFSLWAKTDKLYFRILLWAGFINLVILALLYCKERFYSIGQFFEYSLQFGSPLFLLCWFRIEKGKTSSALLIFWMKIAIALTFTCHGLYAIGYYSRPIGFMEMTMNILHVDEPTAIQFLQLAGILDFIVSIGIFMPYKWSKYFLSYTVCWGFLTALARIWANFDLEWLDYVMMQWLHETIYRFPHFLIPASVLLYTRKPRF